MKKVILALLFFTLLSLSVLAAETLEERMGKHEGLIKKIISDPTSINLSQLSPEEMQLLQDINNNQEEFQRVLQQNTEKFMPGQLSETMLQEAMKQKLEESKTGFNEAISKTPRIIRWLILRKGGVNVYIGEQTVMGIKLKEMLMEEITLTALEKPTYEIKIPMAVLQKLSTENANPAQLIESGEISIKAKTVMGKIKLAVFKRIVKAMAKQQS